MNKSKVIVSLDYSNAKQALDFCQKVNPMDCRIKVGKELFTAEGPIFVHIHSVPEIQNEPIGRRTRDPRNRSTNDAIKDLRTELGTL